MMPIHILPSNLSSQISAGEIIERPASVVKEIIENSIDAGSKKINIVIEKSGFQSIFIQDDGFGMNKKDLSLSIDHHATSKIKSLSDLDKITTFGFRGEALASIRAVSRLTVMSRTNFDDIAWKIYSEGFFNNDITIQPIGHPQGTTIIVENLFYNIPVRLKFIKNKKLEFLKIVEVIKKIALSHFFIQFSFKHNKKLIFQYDSINNKIDKIHRLKDVLKIFDMNELLEIKAKKNNIFLFGWILDPQNFKESRNIQYCYVNNRYIHNHLFLNAVRTAYYTIFGKKNISFVLYLNIPPNGIDINIHPTKNEIKFHEGSMIYTFIYESILYHLKRTKKNFLLKKFLFIENLKTYNKMSNNLNNLNSNCSKLISFHSFKKIIISKNEKIFKENYKNITSNINLKLYNYSIGKLLIVFRKYYGLIYHNNDFSLISFPLAKGIIRKKRLQNDIKKKIVPSFFLVNVKINVISEEYMILFDHKEILLTIGFQLIFKKKHIVLSSIPCFLKKQNINIIVSTFFKFLFLQKKVSILEIVNWFYNHVFIELKSWNYINGVALLLEIEYYYPLLLKNPPPKLLQKININAALCVLKI